MWNPVTDKSWRREVGVGWAGEESSVVPGTSLVVQRLRLCASPAGGAGAIPGQRTKILHVSQCGQKGKKR